MCQRTSRKVALAAWLCCMAGLAMASSGCLVVGAGLAGGAVGYAYYRGKVCEVYQARLDDTFKAAKTALGELGMSVLTEELKAGSAFIETRASDGEKVRLQFEALQSRIPAEGEITRLCVRVATFGDRPVSERILNQVGLHLTPVAAAPAVIGPVQGDSGVQQTGARSSQAYVPSFSQTNNPTQPKSAASTPQTAPPPLLLDEPLPVRK